MGFERAGIKTAAFCEIDKDSQKVLKKHWPEVDVHDDIKQLNGKLFKGIDVICGGFPCQDISVGGKQKGILKGTRSSLWKEYWRIINEAKPRYVVIENVERLRKNGLGVVLSDLAKIGYDAEWHNITGTAVGLPHQRERLYIIAHPSGFRFHEYTGEEGHLQTDSERANQEAYTYWEKRITESGPVRAILSRGTFDDFKNSRADETAALSRFRRVTDGIPEGLDEIARKKRIRQLGNSVVPFIAEIIGRRIMLTELLA